MFFLDFLNVYDNIDWLIDWLIDFTRMLTCLGLFYGLRLDNHVYIYNFM